MSTPESFEFRNPIIEQLQREIAKTISATLPEGYGFALFMFKYYGPESFYISSGDREGVIHSIRQWLERMEQKEEYSKFYAAVRRVTSFVEAHGGENDDTAFIRLFLQ